MMNVTAVDMKRLRRIRLVAAAIGLVLGGGALFAWYEFFREVPQPAFASAEERFKYGSLGGENEAGIPYWVFIVLPRMFPEHLPGPGGYASLGIPWEQGHDLPIGFPKKTIGFERVGNNCAVCHTASYRASPDENPTFVVAAPGHTANVQAFFRFLIDCAKDPRFTPDNVMREIALVYRLSFVDRLLYRFAIIPIVKQRLLEREGQFAWMNRHGMPAWGRGRDDPMNLTKYFMLERPEDGTFGPADMPSIWNLDKYKEGQRLNWDGATADPRSVLVDSALGIVVKPQRDFEDQMQWLEAYLRKLPAPKYPYAVDLDLAGIGAKVFDEHCAQCHRSERTGKPVPVGEVGTDRNRLESWNRQAAIDGNKVVAAMGVTRRGLVEEDLVGYIAAHLDGLWLRGPFLHNGSVPTLADLLEPAARRPRVFYRGYDVYDQRNVGFVADGPEAQRIGTRLDVSERGNGNQGHEYGTALPAERKRALIEYLKTL
jgi:mono/diheme cytochrome c family protein